MHFSCRMQIVLQIMSKMRSSRNLRIGIIGFGSMGSAIAKALKGTSITGNILCCDPNKEKRQKAAQLGFGATGSVEDIAQKCNWIFLCVKPYDLQNILVLLKPLISSQVLLSIAAGKRIRHIEKWVGKKKIVRVMPNIAALASQSVNVYSCKNVSAQERRYAAKLLSSFGSAMELPEKYFDAVTAVSGSGPAFVAYFIESLAHAGVRNGLPQGVAYRIALETAAGTVALLKEKGLQPKIVRDRVTSKGGTTAAGRKVLEDGMFQNILINTITAAKRRSGEIGRNG